MPRNYKRKTTKGDTPADVMERASRKVVDEKKSLRDVAKDFEEIALAVVVVTDVIAGEYTAAADIGTVEPASVAVREVDDVAAVVRDTAI
ncbi:Hypothetical predicted protein [Octopus vulgaris]|uniref:Uncharacterized protein n=1 Tax=Octopus vulgaris TaxID=6645 RepID=A0AA36ARW9_OCTVU|nr:Hypothetical predicted protein [Octopus vulgaris]